MKVNFKGPAISLHNVDPADIDDVLMKIQHLFGIRFEQEDLEHVKTFGNLCDAVVKKVKDRNAESACTTQHAFYTLRNAVYATTNVEKEMVKPQTRLAQLFPRDTRLEVIAEVEKEMGFKINLLKPKGSVVATFVAILVISLAGAFFYPAVGGLGAALAIVGLILAGKFGKEMPVKTLGDLAEKISREHYRSCRKNASTINRAEVAEKIKDLFIHDLAFEPSALTRDLRF